jgi:hypothetical protein
LSIFLFDPLKGSKGLEKLINHKGRKNERGENKRQGNIQQHLKLENRGRVVRDSVGN